MHSVQGRSPRVQSASWTRPVRRRRRAAAAAISATPPPPTVRARRAAAADIFVDRRGGVAVPNSSLWLCVRAKLHICLLIVCWTDIGMKTLILSSFCSCVPMFSKAIISCSDNKRAVRTRLLGRRVD